VQGDLDKFDMYVSFHASNSYQLRDNPQVFGLSLFRDPTRFWNFTSKRPKYEFNEEYTEMGFLLCSPKVFLRGVASRHLTDVMIDKILNAQLNAVQWLVPNHANKITRARALKSSLNLRKS